MVNRRIEGADMKTFDMKKLVDVETIAVTRYGDTFYVIGFPTMYIGADVSGADAEKYALAQFSFFGPCSRNNPSCVAAHQHAERIAKTLMNRLRRFDGEDGE